MKIRAVIVSLFLTLAGGICLQNPTSIMAQVQNPNPTLRFAKESLSKENETYTLPIYLNTKGQNVSAIEIKINAGSVDLLSLKTSPEISTQEIFSYVKENKAYLSLTANNITAGISNNKEQAVALLKFVTFDDEPVTFSLDPDETMVVSSVTDDNVLLDFDSFTFTGKIAPNSDQETIVNETTGIANNKEEPNQKEPNQAITATGTTTQTKTTTTAVANKNTNKIEATDLSEDSENTSEKNSQIFLLAGVLLFVLIVGGGVFFFIKNKKQRENQNSLQNNTDAVNSVNPTLQAAAPLQTALPPLPSSPSPVSPSPVSPLPNSPLSAAAPLSTAQPISQPTTAQPPTPAQLSQNSQQIVTEQTQNQELF